MASPRKAEKSAKASKAKAKPASAKAGTGSKKPTSAPAKPPAKASKRQTPPDIANADPALFDPLTPGEAADALRTLTEDKRVASMAKVGRYRVICTEPLVVKPPHWMAGHRLARVVAYDYASDRCVDACIDLDAGVVAHLELTKAQPMLSYDEEALAVSIALSDERVTSQLGIGEVAQSTMHYWGRTQTDISYSRRSAAVVFGRQNGHATLVAVIDLLDNQVTKVVPAEQW